MLYLNWLNKSSMCRKLWLLENIFFYTYLLKLSLIFYTANKDEIHANIIEHKSSYRK
jgi:hypothetical protein